MEDDNKTKWVSVPKKSIGKRLCKQSLSLMISGQPTYPKSKNTQKSSINIILVTLTLRWQRLRCGCCPIKEKKWDSTHFAVDQWTNLI